MIRKIYSPLSKITKYSAIQEENWDLPRWRVKLHDLFPDAVPQSDKNMLRVYRKERDRFLKPEAEVLMSDQAYGTSIDPYSFDTPPYPSSFDSEEAEMIFNRSRMFKRRGLPKLAEQALVEQGVSRPNAKDTVDSVMSVGMMFDLVADHFEDVVNNQEVENLMSKHSIFKTSLRKLAVKVEPAKPQEFTPEQKEHGFNKNKDVVTPDKPIKPHSPEQERFEKSHRVKRLKLQDSIRRTLRQFTFRVGEIQKDGPDTIDPFEYLLDFCNNPKRHEYAAMQEIHNDLLEALRPYVVDILVLEGADKDAAIDAVSMSESAGGLLLEIEDFLRKMREADTWKAPYSESGDDWTYLLDDEIVEREMKGEPIRGNRSR